MKQKKPKVMKSNTIVLGEAPKARNEGLHQARHNARAGRQTEKTDFTRARDKQAVRRAINEG